VKPDGKDGQEASESLTLLATALMESNTPVPAKVKHIVSEHSAPVPTAKGLKTAVDKMDKARTKLKEAQKARANLHANWRKYLAEEVDAKKTALEELEEDVAVEITDDDMPDKIDTAEDIQENINAMVNNLQNLQQRADAAIVEAAEGKNKRQRIEAPDGGVDASLSAGHAPGRASTAMKPFGVPDK
jgi:chromosome segregation ATPase